ncbi:MAG: hypothetical protein RI894_424 [Bacteroidota bacterium]|jgi:GNAT superfamily N-acetyltransferase
MDKKIKIRGGLATDMPDVHSLVYELAVYEKEPESVTATVADYIRDFNDGVFKVLIAENEAGEVVGMMLYYIAYSTWRGKMVYLDDFVVRETARGQGIGQILWNALLAESRNLGARLLKWQVLDWNEPAVRFYERADAIIEKEWWNGKVFL